MIVIGADTRKSTHALAVGRVRIPVRRLASIAPLRAGPIRSRNAYGALICRACSWL